MTAPRLSLDAYAAGVVARDRAILARAITLVESDLDEDRAMAEALLARLPPSDTAVRVGITGVPGVGKSTLIDALGVHVAQQRRVAVLAVDPSSALTGGSILGDKTRMPRLSASDAAFVRPSPSALTLGGVARRTRETMLVCEAAGFDAILIETVGVGQSETAVAEMVDTFVLLALPGAGDELQGIKKGILELADLIAVNKADGDNVARARAAMRELKGALPMIQRRRACWTPEVVLTSALTGEGVPELWSAVLRHRAALEESGDFGRQRDAQRTRALAHALGDELERALAHTKGRADIERDVARGVLSPSEGARRIIASFKKR